MVTSGHSTCLADRSKKSVFKGLNAKNGRNIKIKDLSKGLVKSN